MSGKKGRKHHQKQPQKNVASGARGGLASHAGTVNADADHCEEVQNKNNQKEEPTQLPRKWEWDLTTLLNAILAAGTVAAFVLLWLQLQDARDNFAESQRPYIWVMNGPDNVLFPDMAPNGRFSYDQPVKIVLKYPFNYRGHTKNTCLWKAANC